MSLCRSCYSETHEAAPRLCGACLMWLRDTCDRIAGIQPELKVEIAKQSAKGRQGGSGDKAQAPVNLAAVDADMGLTVAVKALQGEGKIRRDGDPRTLKAHAQRLQHPGPGAAEDDHLRYYLDNLSKALAYATQMVDTREEATTVGRCTCGRLVHTTPGRATTKCRHCGEQVQVAVATETLRDQVQDGLSGSRLKDTDMVAAIATTGHTTTTRTIQSWVRRGKLARDSKNRTAFDDVLELVEIASMRS